MSLSISGDASSQISQDGALTIRDTANWFPDIPDPRLSFIGVESSESAESNVLSPLSVAALSGRLETQDLHHFHKITVRIGEGGNIWGLDIFFADERHTLGLGVDGIISQELLSFEMNPGGEHMVSADVLYMCNGLLLGFKVIYTLRIMPFNLAELC